MVNEILGANIRKYRLAINWTQEKLADILCVSHQVISKWENGIAAPDITILCSLTRIFNVSLDDLCGISSEYVNDFIEEIEGIIQKENTSYPSLHAKWDKIEKQLIHHPTNDKLLFVTLNFLRTMHDKIETDAQKEMVNEEILKVSERLLDFSRNDSYRSYANYNLAVYYSEQVNLKRSNELDIKNAEKSKMYADLVLYKDMHKSFYRIFGATTLQEDLIAKEKTLIEMIDATKRACENLIRCYTHNTCSECNELLNEIEVFSSKLSSHCKDFEKSKQE
ncbi:MAG: helix-turn-helix transcriptional regulator [Clostridia bacterium]|nr:helix-turn-helix transcriptional regulator [Clostridia bacterium]